MNEVCFKHLANESETVDSLKAEVFLVLGL